MSRFSSRIGGSVPDVFGQIKVLMLYTPFPPETASIFAMLQFLQSLGCSVHTEMHIYIYIFMAYIYTIEIHIVLLYAICITGILDIVVVSKHWQPPKHPKNTWAMESQIWSSLNLRTQIPLVIQVFEANLSPPLSVSEIAAQNHRTRQDIPQPS